MSRPRDKDGGWAWVVLCACAVCVMVTSGVAILAGMFQEVFLEEFEGGVVMTSWITSLYASLMQLVGPVTGVVCSVFGCRSSVMAGGTLLAAGFLSSSFCSGLTTLLLAFGIAIGAGLGLVYSAAIVAVSLSFERYRPVATGSVLAAGGLGIMLTPLLCRFLLDAYGWRHTLGALCALSAQLVVAGALLFPPSAGERRQPSRRLGNRRQFLCCFERRQQTPASQPVVEKLSEKPLPLQCAPQECAPQNSPQRAHTDVGEGSESAGHCHNAEGIRDQSNQPDSSSSSRHSCHDVFPADLSTCRPEHVDAAVTDRLLSDGTRSAREGGVGNFQDLQPPKFSSQSTGGSSEHAPASDCSEHGPTSRLGEHAPTSSSSEHGPTSSSSEHGPTSSSSEHGLTSSSSEHALTSRTSEHAPTTSSSEHEPTSRNSEHAPTSRTREHGPTSRTSEHGSTATTTSEDEETAPFLSSDSTREQTLTAAAVSISTSLAKKDEELTLLAISTNSSGPQRPKPSSSHHPDLSSDRREGTWCRYLAVVTNRSLVTICLQLCLGNAAVGIVLVHFAAFSLQTGSDNAVVSTSFSANGAGLTVGRFLLGILVQDRHVDPLSVYVGLAFVTSVLMVVTPVVAFTAAWQITMMLAVGFYSGSSYSLLTEITIHCTGVDALGFAFGMEMISAGLGFLVAPPIAGWLVELTSSYGNAIFLAGVLYFVAACVAMAISVMRPIWKPGGHPGHFEKVVTSQAPSSAEDMT